MAVGGWSKLIINNDWLRVCCSQGEMVTPPTEPMLLLRFIGVTILIFFYEMKQSTDSQFTLAALALVGGVIHGPPWYGSAICFSNCISLLLLLLFRR